jgi:hypothetical protein
MKEITTKAFATLFREAYRKCFPYEITSPLTESESNHFSSEIFEKTGLLVGWKSLKNYSHYVLDMPGSKPENPSVSTLDTLARYVAEAPVTDEVQRKKRESHYPYWFRYKETFYKTNLSEGAEDRNVPRQKRFTLKSAIVLGLVFVVMVFLAILFRAEREATEFTEEFDSVVDEAWFGKGWFLKSIDAEFWARRGEKPGHLAMFTLRGDNWPDSGKAVNIKNLLLRKGPFNCFVAEIHLTEFFPRQNWQQAGLLLLEDTSFAGKSLRMSIGYNDFSGGFTETREIIVQAITSLGSNFSKPEEIVHHQLFTVDSGTENLIRENLAHSALRIERHGDTLRLLYSTGKMKNSAFKEVVNTKFDMNPAYLGIFALKGFVGNSDNMPAYIDFFSLTKYPCDD